MIPSQWQRLALPLLALATAASGCSSSADAETFARMLVCQNTSPGKAALAVLGTPEQLITAGRINAHRRVSVEDGVELDTWLIAPRSTPRRGTVLILHGLADSKAGYLDLGERLATMGFAVVLPDLRAHGRSGGQHVTFGALEKRDIKRLMDDLVASGDTPGPLYVLGVSMGGAIAVRYAAMDDRCRGVVAVAPYKDARDVVRRMVPLMDRTTYDAVWARAGQMAGFDPHDTSTTAAAAMLRCPLVVVHGLLDNLVPYSHGLAVYKAAPQPKLLRTAPLAGHSTILLGREAWLANQVAGLEAMRAAHGSKSSTSALHRGRDRRYRRPPAQIRT